MLEELRGEFVLHEHDDATLKIDDFFDFHRGKLPLTQALRELDAKYDDAEEKAGLAVNAVGRSHLLLKTCGISPKASR